MGDGIPRSPPRAIAADRPERFPSDLLATSVRPACNVIMGGLSDQRKESDCKAFVGRQLRALPRNALPGESAANSSRS